MINPAWTFEAGLFIYVTRPREGTAGISFIDIAAAGL